MISIGVTGRIGSGKTFVCKSFSELGVPIFYSDTVARGITDTHKEIQKKIIAEFSTKAYQKDLHVLDRKFIADIVFNDRTKLEILNSIVHPVVFNEFERWKDKLKQSKKQLNYCIAESAILFESGFSEITNYSLSVISDDALCVTRVVERDKTDVLQVKKRLEFQLSNEMLEDESDFTIQNNGTIEELQQKVKFFHSLFSVLQPKKEIEE